MNSYQKWIAPLLACSLMLTAMPAGAAAAGEINVQIPDYPIEINGVSIDSTQSSYPLLSYKGITYFPMTWDFSQALGLSVKWDDDAGLTINQDYSIRNKPVQDTGGSNVLSKAYQARKPGYAVTVNGKKINNAKEEYPLLEFREITYFPMTWRFAVDDFKWNIGWNADTGFKVISPQRKLLSEIVYDDGQYLYASSNLGDSYYQIAKSLQQTPVLLTEAESQATRQKIGANPNQLDYSLYKGERTVRDNTIITFQGIQLTSLQPFVESNDAYYAKDSTYENKGVQTLDFIAPLDSNRMLVSLAVYTLNHIPAPYTPHTYQTFIVDTAQKQATLIEGLTQAPDLLYKNSDGTFWLASNAPAEYNTRSLGRYGQLVLLDKEGTAARLINREFQVADIDTLTAIDGKLLIRAYNDRLAPNKPSDKDGFYLIDTAGQAEKKFDNAQGRVYADPKGAIYVIDPIMNKIVNLPAGQSKLWYDYELKE